MSVKLGPPGRVIPTGLWMLRGAGSPESGVEVEFLLRYGADIGVDE